jgi:acetyl-CoA acetyltransferase
MMDLRGHVAVVGVGESELGSIPGKSSLALHAEAARAALRDAGIAKEEVDGVLTNDSYHDYHVRHAMAFAEYFGIPSSATMITTMPLGSAAAGGLFLHEAAALILSGRCQTVLAVTADNFLSALGRGGAVRALAGNRDKGFEAPYGPLLPACFALVARRYMYETGTTSEQLAHVAVTMREHARRNPAAHMREPITVEDVLASPMIADPLHRLDCSVVSDGGAALVITSAERAKALRKPPVYLLGAANCHGDGSGRLYSALAQSRDLTRTGTARSAPEALSQAGLTHADVDVVSCYDPFSVMPLVLLESAGFFPRGTAGGAAAEGALRVGGQLPVNPHGGLLSYCHPGNPGGMFMLTEMVRQLRHEAANQVPSAEIGIVLGYGGEFAIWPVTVLGNAAP